MALNNSQYEEIMRMYQATQLRNKDITNKRREWGYETQPKLKELDDSISTLSLNAARKRLEGDTQAVTQLREEMAAIRQQKADLIAEMGLCPDYFEPVYTCPHCKDTGFVDGQKCRCFNQASLDIVYAQSNMHQILARENFSNFSYAYYSDQDINPTTGLSALETAQRAVTECKNFIQNFEEKPKNLFFYGDTGVGKTFLSNCVAKELLDQGKSVIYFTSFQLFDILSKGIFERDAAAKDVHQSIFDCDLLIIDDLGTELSNAFTTSQLFLCVNERILRQKSTIISTNLDLNQIVDVYSERTFSRILSNYSIIKLFGDDIRIKKRRSPNAK